MGKSRNTNNHILNKLTSSAIEWITHIVDFIEEDMSTEEIDYVNKHMENIHNFSANGIYRSENSNRTFNKQNLQEGSIFSFDNGEFKAFTKDDTTVGKFSSDTLSLRGESTIFHITKGKAFDVSKLNVNDVLEEQEVWVSSQQSFKVNKISTTTLEEMNYNKNNLLPTKLWNRIKDKKINMVEISEVNNNKSIQ